MARLKRIVSDPIFLLWLVVLVVLLPILRPGFFSVHDDTHFLDIYEMWRSLTTLGFPPRFIPDTNFGLGHPYFNFYYQLPFFITSIFHFVGFSFLDSFKYMMGLSVIIAASGFYFWVREYVGKIPATIASVIYLLSPYFAVDLYVRGAFGELYLFALFPWAAFFLTKFLTIPTGKNLALTSLVIGLIGIAHNVLLPFIYSFLFLFGIAQLFVLKKNFKSSLIILLPFLLGVALCGYYLLPAFDEVKFISSYEQFNIVDHFPFIKQLIIPNWGYSVSIWGPNDDLSFNIGVVNLLMILLSVPILKFANRGQRILIIFFLVIFSIAVILMNSRTLVFWESIRFLRLVQFPWRMLMLTVISSSFISALVLDIIFDKYKKIAPIFFVTVFGLVLALNIWHFQPSAYKNETDEDYLARYLANRTTLGNGERSSLSPEYLNFSEDFIPLTIWQSSRTSGLMDEVKLASNSGQVNFQKSGLTYDISYNVPKDDKILIAKTYFPGWEAISNSGKLIVEPFSEYGIISVPVGPGEGSFKLSFQNTAIRNYANTLSVFAALVIMLLLIFPVFKKLKND